MTDYKNLSGSFLGRIKRDLKRQARTKATVIDWLLLAACVGTAIRTFLK